MSNSPLTFAPSLSTHRGTRAYVALTSFAPIDRTGPTGRYEIEKLSSTMWVVTHTQVNPSGEGVTRRIGAERTLTAAKSTAAGDYAIQRDLLVGLNSPVMNDRGQWLHFDLETDSIQVA